MGRVCAEHRGLLLSRVEYGEDGCLRSFDLEDISSGTFFDLLLGRNDRILYQSTETNFVILYKTNIVESFSTQFRPVSPVSHRTFHEEQLPGQNVRK